MPSRCNQTVYHLTDFFPQRPHAPGWLVFVTVVLMSRPFPVLHSILESDWPGKRFSFEVKSSPSWIWDYPVIREHFILVGCQTAVKLTSRTIFFAPTLCKLNSILCRRNKWTCDLSRSHLLPSGASLKPSALSQSTCGKTTIIYESS